MASKDLRETIAAAAALTPKKGIENVAAGLSPKAHRAAQKPSVIADAFGHDVAYHFSFLGSGQAGARISQSFYDLGYRRVAFFNTTDSDFAGLSDEPARMSLDIGGAAKDMRLARQALQGREEEVRDLLQRAWGDTTEWGIICVGLGGGTGSGTAKPLIELARKFMESKGKEPRVGAVVSLPFVSDGQQIARNAVTAFNELIQAKVSPLVVIDNDRVHKIYNPSMRELLPKSNQLVSRLFHLFNELAATRSEHITFDRAEFGQLLSGGIVVMGSADIPVEDIKSPADVSTKIREELTQSVLASVDLKKGRTAACIFVAGDDVLDSLNRDFFNAGFTQLDRIVGAAHPEGTEKIVHRGIYPGVAGGLQCYTLVADLEPPADKLAALGREAGLGSRSKPSVANHLGVD